MSERAIQNDQYRVMEQKAPTNGLEDQLSAFLSAVVVEDQAATGYFEAHLARVKRTLLYIPVAKPLSRALEIGSYLQMAAALNRVLGYASVVGCYYSATLGRDRRTLMLNGHDNFTCDIDLFDAERDRFPYCDAAFELVLCCEVIEHLIHDPMHLLGECHRVLAHDGLLVLTTPNVASLTSVAASLHGWRNPQVFSRYPSPDNHDTPHVREYTPREVADVVNAAGFELEALFTERLPGFDDSTWVRELLKQNGFDTAMRGEQIYCLARKKEGGETDRFPKFLYV